MPSMAGPAELYLTGKKCQGQLGSEVPRVTPHSANHRAFRAERGAGRVTLDTPQCLAWLFSLETRLFFFRARLFSSGTRRSTEPRSAPFPRRASLSRSRPALRDRLPALSR